MKFLALFSCLVFTAFASENKPNIVFFIADDISQEDFGCYGHPTIKTPNVDALAKGGMRFDNAYLTTSSCSPSRISILTGRYPHNTGAPELHVIIPDEQIRFPELLKQAGYYTALSGKNHMFKKKDRSFDLVSKGGGPGGEKDWVELVQKRPKDKPFFFWFAANDAHRAWQHSDDAPTYENKDIVVPPYLYDSETTRKDLAAYYHEVSRYDHFIGKVRDELKAQGVLDNTMIVIAADNGRPFPRSKSRLYDSGIKTPWVVHYPKVIQEPAITKSFISVIDLAATCLDIAGVEKHQNIQGVSFLDILKDPKASTRDMVFSEHNWHVYKNHERMVRFGDFTYIKNNFTDQMNLAYEAHKYPAGEDLWQAHEDGKTNAAQQQTFAFPSPAEELFILSKDPHQLKNEVNNPEYQEILQQARKQLAKWTEQTGDSIPSNPTPDRHAPPRFENGKWIKAANKYKVRNPHAEMPGASQKAEAIHHPGPIRF